jgi:DNA polymerase I-like protein with 3'-5' exonuclease and polymerase domains
MAKHFISGKYVACDTETTGLRLWKGDAPFAFSFCNEDGETAYLEWRVDPKTRKVIPVKDELRQLIAFFEDESITKVFHNAKFDVRALERGHGIIVCGPGGAVREGGRVEETVFAAHACNSREASYGLKELSDKYLGFGQEDKDELKACVRKLRNRAKKDGWKIGTEEKEKADGQVKSSPEVEADYWIPATAFALKKPWVTKEEASLCERYATQDAERTMLLWKMYQEVMEELKVRDTYEREIALFDTVYRMETRGVTVSDAGIDKAIVEGKEIMNRAYQEIQSKYGWKGINLRSHVQVGKMLFEKNKVPLHPKYKKSTKMEAIVRHISNPAVNALLRYRTYEKGIGTFYLKYKRLGTREHMGEGLLTLHASFKQTGADTSRFSCSDPNLQQVSSPESSKNSAALAVREPFHPRDGMWWISSDYDGQEIRLYAEISKEPNMMKALAEKRDIHSMIISKICGGEGNPIALRGAVQALGLDGVQVELNQPTMDARKLLGVKPSKVYDVADQNRIASAWLSQFKWDIEKAEKSVGRKNTRGRLKMTTFGRCYGASAKTLAETLREPIENAQQIIEIYKEQFPDMDQFMRDMIRKVQRDGYVRTLWNRRLVIDPELAYTVVNYLIQGTASDLLKHAMENIDQFFRREGIDGSVLMPIHDELITEVPAHLCTVKFIRRYASIMEDTGGHLMYPIPTKPLLIIDSWHRPRAIKGYPYA